MGLGRHINKKQFLKKAYPEVEGKVGTDFQMSVLTIGILCSFCLCICCIDLIIDNGDPRLHKVLTHFEKKSSNCILPCRPLLFNFQGSFVSANVLF
jgi:hypothetical protein